MSSCYPRPGSVKILDKETLILESNYSSSVRHTGVMGLFYLLVAEPSPKANSFMHSPVDVSFSFFPLLYSILLYIFKNILSFLHFIWTKLAKIHVLHFHFSTYQYFLKFIFIEQTYTITLREVDICCICN